MGNVTAAGGVEEREHGVDILRGKKGRLQTVEGDKRRQQRGGSVLRVGVEYHVHVEEGFFEFVHRGRSGREVRASSGRGGGCQL